MDGRTAAQSRVLLHAGPDEVAEALAARLMARLTEIQRDLRTPQIALTGGRIATRAYQTARRRRTELSRRLVAGRAVVGRRAVCARGRSATGMPSKPLICLPSR